MASADDIAAALEGAIGANDESATVKCFLDTGYPELNYALSNRWDGGIAGGRICEISGPSSSGKTAIATSVMATAQKMGGVAGFSDHERSFSTRLAPRLGLDITPGRFIYKKPRTFEEAISLCVRAATIVREKGLIPDTAPIAWVFDSLASMVPKSVLIDQKTGKDREAESRNMNDNTALARATSAHLSAFAQYCEELDICAMFLNQIRTKLNVTYGDPRTTPGGEAPKFYASQRLMLGASKIVKDKVVLGTEITGLVIKNKVTRPYLSSQWRFVFQKDGTGKFDTYRSTIEFLLREKLLERKGNYIVWEGKNRYPEELARMLETANEFHKLVALLPKIYEPEMDPTAMALGAEEEPEDGSAKEAA